MMTGLDVRTVGDMGQLPTTLPMFHLPAVPLNWETLTASALLQSGADLIVLRHPESLARLEADSVEGVVDNGLQLKFLLRAGNKPGLRVVDSYEPILVGHLAFAVRKNDTDLLTRLDRSLSRLEAAGTVTQIKKKWGID